MTMRWNVTESIALELELVCQLLSAARPDELPPAAVAVPPEWWAEGAALAGEGSRWAWSLGTAAWLARVLTESDYRTATLAIRELTAEAALERLAAAGGPPGEAPAAGQARPAGELVERLLGWLGTAFGQYGLTRCQSDEGWSEHLRRELTAMTRILKGGDLHARFWLWMDQGYFQFYQPFRAAHREQMTARAEAARTRLAAQGVSWLPPQNPLQYYPGFRTAVERGDLELLCWIEPFGEFDRWYLFPGVLLVAVGEPGEQLAGFRAGAERVASRLKALADPTRLLILRLVRHLAMDNTEMAGYLGVTRQTVSVHAQVLREAGLIQSTQRGRQASHTVIPGEVERLCDELLRFLDVEPTKR